MLVYLLVVYGLGTAWLWWIFFAVGQSNRTITGLALVLGTAALAIVVRIRSRRLRSPFEWISSRAITHGGTAGGSRWSRDRSERPDDPGDFEAHVGGGL